MREGRRGERNKKIEKENKEGCREGRREGGKEKKSNFYFVLTMYQS